MVPGATSDFWRFRAIQGSNSRDASREFDTLATFCDPSGIGPGKIKAINAGPKVGRGILVISDLAPKTKPMFLGVFDQNTGARWVSDTLATFCDPSGIGPETIKAIKAGPKAGRGILVINDLVPKTKPIFSGLFDQNTGARWVSDTLATYCDPSGIGPGKIKAINAGPKVGRMD